MCLVRSFGSDGKVGVLADAIEPDLPYCYISRGSSDFDAHKKVKSLGLVPYC